MSSAFFLLIVEALLEYAWYAHTSSGNDFLKSAIIIIVIIPQMTVHTKPSLSFDATRICDPHNPTLYIIKIDKHT